MPEPVEGRVRVAPLGEQDVFVVVDEDAGGRESWSAHCRIRSGVQWASAAARSASLTRVITGPSSAAVARAATITAVVAAAASRAMARDTARRRFGEVVRMRRGRPIAGGVAVVGGIGRVRRAGGPARPAESTPEGERPVGSTWRKDHCHHDCR
ncbi:hypothetical protein [Amycolatopsis pigmentata]|uniref:Uncharacterized protein n=1 Tax=Amycolatopsis pigmentata TaxID=450801 RepID=A0ABW5G366_9PSEU